MITISTTQDVKHILNNLREDDYYEALYSLGFFDEKRITEMVMNYPGFAVVYRTQDGEPVGMGGIRNNNGERIAWLLATDRFSDHGVSISKTTKNIIHTALNEYPNHKIVAYSWDKHKNSAKWLQWIGFVKQRGLVINGQPFTEFALKRVH